MARAKSFKFGIAALFAACFGISAIGVAEEPISSDELIAQLTPKVERGLAAAGVLGPAVNLSVRFEFNSTQLTPVAVTQIENVGVALTSKHLDNFDFLLVGHSDSSGSRGYNQRLSEQRAASVRNHLMDKFGLSADRLLSLGMGEDNLLLMDDPESGANRRVELRNIGDSDANLTRGTAGNAPIAGTNTISSATSTFCVEEGVQPEFAVLDAPTIDEPILVRRRTSPSQLMNGIWRAGDAKFVWSSDWPMPEEGRYIWSIGSRGTSSFSMVQLEQPLSTPHDKAAAYHALGCEAQVAAAYNEIIASSAQ